MRIAYHPNSKSITAAALDIWLNATVAGWPTVGAGILITVKSPSYPLRVEDDTISEDRVTLSGKIYAKVRYTAKRVSLTFGSVEESHVGYWRTFYDATNGFRLPFILETPLTLTPIILIGAGPFPFTHNSMLTYNGSVEWIERL